MVELRINYKYDYMYFPVDHVTGVVGARKIVQAMADELDEMGCSDKAMKVLHGDDGANLLEGDGAGWVGKLLRNFAADTEIPNLEPLQTELRDGMYVFTVRIENDAQRDAVIEVMRQHGAWYIHTYTFAGIVEYDA